MQQEVASQEKDKTQEHLVLLPCQGKHKQRYLRDSYLRTDTRANLKAQTIPQCVHSCKQHDLCNSKKG